MSRPHGAATAHDRGFDPSDHRGTVFLRTARAETPVFVGQQLDAYVLTRYLDCRAVLTQPAELVSARHSLTPHHAATTAATRVLDDSGFVDTPALVDEDGTSHRIHRAATQSPFVPDRPADLDIDVRVQRDPAGDPRLPKENGRKPPV